MEEQASLEHAGFNILKKGSEPATPHSGPSSTGAENSSRKRKWRHGISRDALKRIDSANGMNVTFLREIVKEANKDVMFRLLTENFYEVQIEEEPTCSYADFQSREMQKKSFVACKHLYFFYMHILGLKPKEHMVIISPSCEHWIYHLFWVNKERSKEESDI